MMDVDSLSKIGEEVADRLLSAVKKDTSGRKP
jgi:hypothetical protein